MDDLLGKLQEILQSDEGQAQLKNVAQMLGGSPGGPSAPDNQPAPPRQANTNHGGGGENADSGQGIPDLSALMQMLSPQGSGNGQGASGQNTQQPDLSGLMQMLSPQGGGNSQEAAQEDSGFPALDMNMLLKIQKMFSTMNIEDENTKLLKALKPHFSDDRKTKIDKAIKMLRLFSLLPMIQESGLLGGLFGDGGL